jgi:hypothetical protein
MPMPPDISIPPAAVSRAAVPSDRADPPRPRTALRLMSALILPLAAGCVVGEHHKSLVFDESIEGVAVLLGSGSVEISEARGSEASVEYDLGGVTVEPVGASVVDGVLIVDLVCEGVCGGDVWVEAPEGAWVKVELHRGDVALDALSGAVFAKVGAGDLEAMDLESADIALALGAGDVWVDTSVSGADVWVDVGAGDLDVTVPEGRYLLDVDVGAGDLSMEGVINDPEGPGRIHAHTGAGSLWLEGV